MALKSASIPSVRAKTPVTIPSVAKAIPKFKVQILKRQYNTVLREFEAAWKRDARKAQASFQCLVGVHDSLLQAGVKISHTEKCEGFRL